MIDDHKCSGIFQNNKIILLETDIKNDSCTIIFGMRKTVIENFSENAQGYGFFDGDAGDILAPQNCSESRTVRCRMPFSDSAKWYMLYKNLIKDEKGEITGVSGVLFDIDDEMRKHRQLIEKIEIDPLTKVYNRETAKEKIEKYISEHKSEGRYALFVLDLDNFKIINDTFGHLYGDAVLTMAAGCIKSAVGEDDIVGRFGGDEFFVFVGNSDADGILKKAENIKRTILSMRKNISDDNDISCSIGIAYANGSGDCYQKLFKMADIALYRSKNDGKNCITEYTEDMGGDIGETDDEIACDINENKTKSHDLVRMAIEIAARSTSFRNAVHMIMRHVGIALDIDDIKIMRVNFDEDIVSIEHHWTKAENVAEMDNRTGYYIHSDIVNLRNKFKERPLFVIDESVRKGFSDKFVNELKKLEKKSVIYSSNLTMENSYYYLVLSCFKPNRVWDKKTLETVNEITKILFVYLMKNYTSKIITDNDPLVTEPHTKLLYYDNFFEKSELIRKLAVENGQKVAVIHSDFHKMFEFDKRYGIRVGETVMLEYAAAINRGNSKYENMCIATHIYGTDIFIILARYSGSTSELAARINAFNEKICNKKFAKYTENKLIIKTGICRVMPGDLLWQKIEEARRLKKHCAELDGCICITEDED